MAAEDNAPYIARSESLAAFRSNSMVRAMARPCVSISRTSRRFRYSISDRRICHHLRLYSRNALYGAHIASSHHHHHHGADMPRSAFVECAVVKKVGSKPFRMAFIRIVGAFLAALYLNLVLPEMNAPFCGVVQTLEALSLSTVLEEWAMSSVRLSFMIFGIIWALMIIQRLMDRLGLMGKLVKPLEPIMIFFGLPRHSAYLWLVGNVLGISYGSAAMIDLEETGKITREEADEVNYHLVMNHSMLEDTMVFASLGVSAFWILSTRMLFAFLVVWGKKMIKLIHNS